MASSQLPEVINNHLWFLIRVLWAKVQVVASGLLVGECGSSS